jgi:hypothetical protein
MAADEHRLEPHLGRPSLYLRDGVATVADVGFVNGVVEFDMAVSGERGFSGAIWRALDEENLEWFFVRPHRSGDLDATQYTPVFHGIPGWQLYHGPRYTAAVAIPVDEWFHVRILVAGTLAEIYVGDQAQPLLFVDGLKREVASGAIGVSSGGDAGAHFADLAFQPTDTPPIRGRAGTVQARAAGMVATWWISDPFSEGALADAHELAPDELTARTWTRLEAEPAGLADLARVNGIRDGRNAVFARTTIRSEREQVKRLDFGFSDRVWVYLNGRLLFRGDDTYRSRDHRFLGSIGYFDALFLPLVEGRNELVLAVSEVDLGGWGVQAQLEDLAGLELEGTAE